ncbi:MAG: hypothetical protein ACKPKO_09390, partial [Candidatus Fonsibacter sp.]
EAQVHNGKQRKLAMMDQQVRWSLFKKASVDIKNKVGGNFQTMSGHMAQQGKEVLGWDDNPKTHVCVASDLRKDKLRDKIR